MKHMLKRNAEIILIIIFSSNVFSFFSKDQFFDFWKLNIKWVKCGQKQFGAISVAIIGSEAHLLGLVAVRFTCEKALTPNGTSTLQPV